MGNGKNVIFIWLILLREIQFQVVVFSFVTTISYTILVVG